MLMKNLHIPAVQERVVVQNINIKMVKKKQKILQQFKWHVSKMLYHISISQYVKIKSVKVFKRTE